MTHIETLAAAVVILGAVTSVLRYLWYRFGENIKDYFRRMRHWLVLARARVAPISIEIEKTDVLMGGRCGVRAEYCLSPNGETTVTAVLTSTEEQINVCRACLDAQLKSRRWTEINA